MKKTLQYFFVITFDQMSNENYVNVFNKQVCHCIDDSHHQISFLILDKDKDS